MASVVHFRFSFSFSFFVFRFSFSFSFFVFRFRFRFSFFVFRILSFASRVFRIGSAVGFSAELKLAHFQLSPRYRRAADGWASETPAAYAFNDPKHGPSLGSFGAL